MDQNGDDTVMMDNNNNNTDGKSVDQVIELILQRKSLLNVPTFPISWFLNVQHQEDVNRLQAPSFLFDALNDLVKGSRTSVSSDQGLTCEALLLMSKSEIQRITQLTSEQVNQLLAYISNTLLYRTYTTEETLDNISSIGLVTALEMEKQPISQIRLSTGSTLMDEMLGGGIVPCGITEIIGESGVGKSQLCMQLCLQTQLPFSMGGLEGGALYISTESDVPVKRLTQMGNTRLDMMNQDIENFNNNNNNSSQSSDLIQPLSIEFDRNVFVKTVTSIDYLIKLLTVDFNQLLTQRVIRLLIIDSIAALFRSEYGNDKSDLFDRTNLLWQLSNQLKVISEEHGITVVVTNQVTDYFEPINNYNSNINNNNNQNNSQEDEKEGGGKDNSNNNNTSTTTIIPFKKPKLTYVPTYQNSKQQHQAFIQNNNTTKTNYYFNNSNPKSIIPALGLSWANFVNTRIMLSKTTGTLPISKDKSLPIRSIELIQSSNSPTSTSKFYIDKHGIFMIGKNKQSDKIPINK